MTQLQRGKEISGHQKIGMRRVGKEVTLAAQGCFLAVVELYYILIVVVVK